jgi:putative peptide zinc metalloprotease protein
MTGRVRHGGVAKAPPSVSGTTHVRLHELSMRPDEAAGEETWIIGRIETGEFIAAPLVARRVITLLAAGSRVEEIRGKLLDEGADVDVADFVTTLAELGFVSHMDGRRLDQPVPPRPTLPWLRPGHVHWLLHPAAAMAAAAIIAAGVIDAVAEPALVPTYRDLLWSGSGGLVIAGNAAIGWSLLFLHELAHLATARGAGVYARMSLSTRLQFLVAQTDVSGIWAAPRKIRLTVYLAGMTTNLVVAAVCVLTEAALPPDGGPRALLAAVALLSLLSVPTQFLVFMRTDVYFVIQDLTGCANLYADASAYLRYHAKRLWRTSRRADPPPTDPSCRLPTRERRAVRCYTIVLTAGTAICLLAAATITWPTAFALIEGAVHAITDNHGSAARLIDGIVVVSVTAAVQLLWLRAWWPRHGHRIRSLLADLDRQRR